MGAMYSDDVSGCPGPRLLIFSIGKRDTFHQAVRQALADLTDDSGRRFDSTHGGPTSPPAPAGTADPGGSDAYRAILGKARRFLSAALPTAELHLITADTPADAARAAGTFADTGADAGVGPLVLVDAGGAGLSTAPFEESVATALDALAAGLSGGPEDRLPARHTVVYAEGGSDDGLLVSRPYHLRQVPDDTWAHTADVVCQLADHIQRCLAGAAARAARTPPAALAHALHAFLTACSGNTWGLHYYTGSVVSGTIRDLDGLAEAAGNPVLRGPSEHSLACGALARWQLDGAPFLTVVTSGMVDEFRGTLANLRDARARGFIVCADSPATAWFPFQGTVHGAEDSRAVLAARGVPHVYLDSPERLDAGLAEAFAAYHEDRGPVVLLVTPSVLEAPADETTAERAAAAATPPARPAVTVVREDEIAPVVDEINHGPDRLLWQCGSLGPQESGLVHEIARKAGIALADSLTRPGSVARYRDGAVVPEYLGTLGVYGFSARVHDYLHDNGRLRARDQQSLLFLKSRIAEAATPFSPRVLKRSLRIAQVTREPEHIAPYTDLPVRADALDFLTAVRERLDVDPGVLDRRTSALTGARESASDALHELPVLPMSANYFFARLGGVLERLITEESYTYTGVYDVGRGGLSAVRNLPRTGPGFSGWYGRALMGDALQSIPAIALTRDDNVLAFIGDGASALVPDIVPTLIQQVCLYGRPLRGNVTVFRLIDGGHSVIRTYHEGRTDAAMSRQTQVLHLLEPEWTRSFSGLTVRHRHLPDAAGADLGDWLTRRATVTICSVPIAHNNEGDGLSLLSAHGWQRDELSDLSLTVIRATARSAYPASGA
ncbi:hypothetical protein ABZ714_02960 [Streptomyces sp. NPDC006798]|uniref:hypothetical protein n=1 Tax=Streptomyces sp. NPDC006798 TaxID=3155462 RepID=UPI0033D4151D